MYGSQKSVLRSRFLLVFIDSWVYRLSKTISFVFVLLYSWEPRIASITRIGPAEQICIGFYSFLVAPPEQNKQFCICFAILLGHLKRYSSTKKLVLRGRFVQVVIDLWLHRPSKTNSFVFVFVYYCESQEASLRKIGIARQFPHMSNKRPMVWPFFDYFSLIFITVYGLGGASADRVYQRVKMPRIFTPPFSTFFVNLDRLRITGLTIGCTARAKQTVLYLFLYIIVNPRKHR